MIRSPIILAMVIVGTMLGGCASSDVEILGKIEEKSMTVPPGGGPLLSQIKKELRSGGWKLFVSRGPQTSRIVRGQETRIETADSFHTRYRLYLSARTFDWCITGSDAVVYDLSIVDNNKGTEVLLMNGRDCVSSIISKFIDALQ